MIEPRTIYTVKSRTTPNIWEFQYDLNGILRMFKLNEGELNETQVKWLFVPARFPYYEQQIQSFKSMSKNFEVIIGKPDLSFDAFWSLYNYKMGKQNAIKQWKKLNELDKLNAIKSIKAYDGFLKRKRGVDKVYAERYLRDRRFEDKFNAY